MPGNKTGRNSFQGISVGEEIYYPNRSSIVGVAGGAWDFNLTSIRSFTDREKQTGMLTHSHASQQTGLLQERGGGVWKTGFLFRRVNSLTRIELQLQVPLVS